MNMDELQVYREQLNQVNQALLNCFEDSQREELLVLKNSIEELLTLTKDDCSELSSQNSQDEYALFMSEMEKEGAVANNSSNSTCDDEYAIFMAEMKKDGALDRRNASTDENEVRRSKNEKRNGNLKDIEGMKCRAPHVHQWGDVAYHNAMICSVVDEGDEEVKVRVLFTNPTHQEMLPCPYYYESDCKFSEEKCRYSHGEIVLYSSLQEYVEPKFNLLNKGSCVLVKQTNNLWYRAIVRQMYDNKCLVTFESNKKSIEVTLEHIFPLDSSENADISSDNDEDDDYNNEDIHHEEREDVINMSLMIKPSNEALGSWEKHTKGIGTRLMERMGYIVGTGLGKSSQGRINPVTAVILPAGKSLDHCMKLREQAGGDENLFNAERKLKRLQKQQERRNQKAYEKAKAEDNNVFNFINQTLSKNTSADAAKEKIEERQRIKQESSRDLNIKSLCLAEDIRRVERDLEKLQESLTRHTDKTSNVHLKLKDKLAFGEGQLKMFQAQAQMIKREQELRHDKKKLTIF